MTWITFSPWFEAASVSFICAEVRHTRPRHFGLLVPQCQMCLDLSLLGLLRGEKVAFRRARDRPSNASSVSIRQVGGRWEVSVLGADSDRYRGR